MPDHIAMTEGQLGARLRADSKGAPKAVFRAMFSAAQRGKAFIVGKSPVDRGILRNAWKVIRLSSINEVQLVNDQPYAGIVERGARPFKISSAGLWALKSWVLRKLKSGEMNGRSSLKTKKLMKRRNTPDLEKEAEGIAYAIAKKFEKVGMKGKRFVLNNLTILASLMDAEVKRSLSTFFNRPLRGSSDG
jgi:Bacteriophage HK97-gp10, putative tail-component